MINHIRREKGIHYHSNWTIATIELLLSFALSHVLNYLNIRVHNLHISVFNMFIIFTLILNRQICNVEYLQRLVLKLLTFSCFY